MERVSILVIEIAFSTFVPNPEKQLEVKRRRRAGWKKITTTTTRALERMLHWLAWQRPAHSAKQADFAKKVLELGLQWRRWMRELVKSWRHCKMSQMPFKPPR